jgi:hypothetical protein
MVITYLFNVRVVKVKQVYEVNKAILQKSWYVYSAVAV